MSTTEQRRLRIFVLASILGAAAAGQASTYTYNFDTIVSGDTPSGSMIATLTISDIATDTVLVNLSHNSTSAAGQFITDLWFNLSPFVTPTQSAQTPLDKFDGLLTSGLDTQNNAGLNFDLRQQFQASGSGGGVNRLKPGESISFILSGTGIDASDFNYAAIPNGGNRDDIFAMIHLQGLPNGGSVKLGTGESFPSVPEPASLGALGIGLAAILRKRRIAKKS